MPSSINVSGAWKTVAGVWVNVSGVWKTAADIATNVSGVWKTGGLVSMGAWTSSANLTQVRGNVGTFGVRTDMIFAGGNVGESGGWERNAVDHFNGTSASGISSLPVQRTQMGCSGVSSWGYAVGGQYMGPNNNFWIYNGTSWLTYSSYPIQIRSVCNVSNGTTALCAGGDNGFGTSYPQSLCYFWSGSAWSTYSALPSTLTYASNGGTATSAVIAGGYTGSVSPSSTYKWDNSSWSTGGNVAAFIGGGGAGTGNNSAIFASNVGVYQFDGNSSIALSPMPVLISSTLGNGTNSSTDFACGGGVTYSPETYYSTIQAFHR